MTERRPRGLGVVVLGSLEPETMASIDAEHRLLLAAPMPDAAAFVRVAPHAEVVVVRSPHVLSREMLDACPRLAAVIRAGSGVDNVDLAALDARGIAFSTTPEAAPAVAELTFAMLLNLVRRVHELHQAVAAGGWPKWTALGSELSSRRLGVLGYGRIGRRVCRLGLAFGMSVIAHNGPSAAEDPEVPIVSFDELMTTSDTLVLSAPLTPETEGLISREVLAKLPPASLLVNVSRGKLVDTEALLDALDSGHLAGAGLDAVAEEPNLPERLRAHPRVVLTPHVGGQTSETQRRIGQAVRSALAVLASGPGRAAAVRSTAGPESLPGRVLE